MRLLYVIDSLVAAGAERSLAAIAPHYRERGIELHVAYLHERDGVHDDLWDAGARLHPVAGGSRPAWIRSLRTLTRAVRPDLVHTTLFEADQTGRIAAATSGVPVVSTLASSYYGTDHITSPHLQAWRVRAAWAADAATARLALRLHAVSGHVADTMAERLRYPRARIDVVPRGRDLARLGRRTPERGEQARSALGVGADDQVVLAVARHAHAKGLDVLLRALPTVVARAPRAHVYVAGRPGQQTEVLEATIGDRGLSTAITLLGERDDVADLLGAADLFVLASRREGMPGALLEAMAMEAPLVATALPQIVELVGDLGVRLVPPEDADALAEALIDTLASPEPGVVTACRQRVVDHHSIELVADAMSDFYERSLADSEQRRRLTVRSARRRRRASSA